MLRSDLGSASSLPKVTSNDLTTAIPASLTGWNMIAEFDDAAATPF